jgi:hypothetical protein
VDEVTVTATFPESGACVVAGALVPIEIDRATGSVF